MKKKIIDELSNINDDIIEKSLEIDTKEKLITAKKNEKTIKRGNLYIWFALGFACVCILFVGVLLGNKNSLGGNTSSGNKSCPDGYVLKDDYCVDVDNPGNTTNTISKTRKEVVIQSYPMLSTLKMSGNGTEDFDFYFIKLNNDGENIVYSPLSIKYALEMLSEGAKGETKTQIDTILGSYRSGKYYNNKNVSFANAMFVNSNKASNINKTYTDNLKNKFNASVIYDSFENANNINKWISDKTLNLINDLLYDSDVQDRFFALVNALAIDMEWINRIQITEEEYGQDPNAVGDWIPSYWVEFKHENCDLYIDAYDIANSMKFNNGNETIEASSMVFGSVFNNYDIIKDLGESKIRETVKQAYNKWYSDEDVQSWLNSIEPEYRDEYTIQDMDKYLDNYIKELKSNYHKYGNSTDYRYYVDDDVKVFAKDLKKYNDLQLEYIQIMPTKAKLSDYIKNLKSSNINNLINKLIEPKYQNYKNGVVTKIVGTIPAFKIEYSLDLRSNLNQLGIYNIFVQDKADLSGITLENVYIDSAIHNAMIEFTNDGIKAAAISMLGGAGDSGSPFNYTFDVPVEIIDLTFDKPFIYLLRDKTTKEVWFTGTVYNPISPEDMVNSFDLDSMFD